MEVIYNGATSTTLSITGVSDSMTGYLYRCIVTDGNSNSLPSNSALLTVISDLVWTGASDTDWNNAGNWSCTYVPTIASLVQIPDVTNKPIISSGAIASVNDLTIDSGSSLTVSGNTLQIAGTITNNGTFTATAGTIEMNGSASQDIGADIFENNTILDLIIDNAAGVTLSGPLSITGILYPENGDLASGGFLTMVSTASQTALISGSGNGSVSGNVTMQRYLPERFGYKYFSSPFQAATVSEFGDDMDLSYWYPTLYEYDESRTSSGWVSYINPAWILEPMHGYAVNFGSVLSADTIDVSGIVNSGALSITLYNNNNTFTQGLNLVGNPYPSPIDWDEATGWTKINIDDAIYYFKSSTTDQYGGTYSSYIGGISSDGFANNIIPSMQGFFVHVSDGAYPVSGTLGMNNSVRITDQTHPFLKSKYIQSKSSGDNPLIRISAEFDDDTGSVDHMVVYLNPFATAGFDYDLDALKLLNTDYTVPNIYFTIPGDKKLSINALPESIEFPIRIPLGVKTNRGGNLVFSLKDLDDYYSIYRIELYDSYTDINRRLLTDSCYSTYLDAAEYHNRFFLDISQVSTETKEPDSSDRIFKAYASGNLLRVEIYEPPQGIGILTIHNVLGQTLKRFNITEPGLYDYYNIYGKGLYIINYRSGITSESKKIFIGN